MVFGDGNPKADILIIGEGPGAEEDDKGLPFVGESGEILDSLLETVNIDRQADTFVTNLVGCRPFNITKGMDGRTKKENRPPSRPEREACWPRLEEVIYRVDPLIILAVGKPATAQLLGNRSMTIDSVRGKPQTMKLGGHYTGVRYTVLPVYHPAYLLRNPNQEEGGPWQNTALDFWLLKKLVTHLRALYYGTPEEEHAED
jgi:DNA polymerase